MSKRRSSTRTTSTKRRTARTIRSLQHRQDLSQFKPTAFKLMQIRHAVVKINKPLAQPLANKQRAKTNLPQAEMFISDKREKIKPCVKAKNVRRHNLFKSGNGSTLQRKPSKRKYKKCP